MTYEGHYPGCTSHPDHEGDCTVARSLPRESVGQIRLQALGLLDSAKAIRVASDADTIDRLHACELIMHDVARALTAIADEADADADADTEAVTLRRHLLGERIRVHAVALMAKP